MRRSSSTVAKTFAALLAAPLLAPFVGASLWSITQDSVGDSFYDHYNFDNISDPTHGRVVYVDKDYAVSNNLTYTDSNHFILRAEANGTLDTEGPGRPSVRLISKRQFGVHVTVADIRHMPEGCGTWPALWEKGDKWPESGEVDIVEGVNDLGPNHATLHTDKGCLMLNSTQHKGRLITENCDARYNSNSGCGVEMPHQFSYGPAFNAIDGGYFAMERSYTSVKVWFWPRQSKFVPLDVRFGLPVINTKLWGLPDAHFNDDACDVTAKFKPSSILINLTLCGDWAGSDSSWGATSCAAKYDKCVDYINAEPEGLKNAYFDFKALRVYEPITLGDLIDTELQFNLNRGA